MLLFTSLMGLFQRCPLPSQDLQSEEAQSPQKRPLWFSQTLGMETQLQKLEGGIESPALSKFRGNNVSLLELDNLGS